MVLFSTGSMKRADSREAVYAGTFGEISVCDPTCTPAQSTETQ